MSSDQRGRGRGGGGGGQRGRGDRGGRGRARGGTMELPFRQGGPGRGGGDFRGRTRGDFGGRGDRGGRGGARGGRDMGPKIYSPQGAQIPPIDQQALKTENDLAGALVAKRQKTPGQALYPERPGFGTLGQKVVLYANYFNLQSVGTELFRYAVDIPGDFAGRKPAGKKVRQIMRLLLDEHFLQYQNSIATDYKSTLIAQIELPEGEYDVRYKDEHDEDYPDNPKVYRVKCQFTGKLNPSDLLNYLTSTNAAAMFESKPEVVQAMNIVLGHHPKSDPSTVSVGANRHFSLHPDLTERYDLGAGLEVLRGFFTSVRAATSRILVNVQVRYAACYQEGPLGGVIFEYQRGNPRDIYRLDSFLKRVRVQVTHIQRKNSKGKVIPRMKTISGLASTIDGRSSPNPPKVKEHGAGPEDVEFFLNSPAQPSQPAAGAGKKGKKPPKAGPADSGRYISVADFFRQEYNKTVDPKMPVVNVGTRDNPSYLPVEVCVVEPGQTAKSKLTPNQTRNMLSFAVRGPAQNAQSIVTKGTSVLGFGKPLNPTLSKFGLETNPALITVPGRVLDAPRVYYKAQKQIQPMSGSWNMKAVQFSTPTKMNSWTWLYVDAQGARQYWRSWDELNRTLRVFTNKLNEIGVATGPPADGMRITLTGRNDENDIDGAVGQLMRHSNPALIFVILHSTDAAIYNFVKLTCDVRRGVRNICVLAERFNNANDQYFANVGLKFNLKLGGMNQSLKSNDLGIISQGKTMLVGIDVTHPSPGSAREAPSVTGVVASVDASLAQWPAELRVQESRQEMVSSLDTMLKSRLQRWARSNKKAYPENIIVYRDGVSEGQYNIVIDKELPLLKKACQEIYPASQTSVSLPRISIVIVGKRHQTRFYPTREEDADRSNNTKNGTVVDRGVTEARNWDFFLQAHTAIKGTARPAHYFTVWDEIFTRQASGSSNQNAPGQGPADVLVNLTHRMCYLFGRATKAVSICPPAYYADLVCERARCYLSHLFDPSPQATPAGSVVSGGGGGGMSVSGDDVEIHPNVRETMFYI